MKLKELLGKNRFGLSYRHLDTDIRGVTCNSKKVKNNYIFFAISGNKLNGENFIPEAISRGAKIIILEKKSKLVGNEKNIIFIRVNSIRRVLSELSAKLNADPSSRINVVGITGTNGKTTLTYLIESILNEAKLPTGVIGTINYRYKGTIVEAANTTPDSELLQKMLLDMVENDIKYALLEVSSHALQQDRVASIKFTDALFTNLSQDHLDYHYTIEGYFQAKSRLFRMLQKDAYAYINVDDAYGQRLRSITKAHKITYSIYRKADIQASDIKYFRDHVKFIIKFRKIRLPITSCLLGKFNIYNILAACAFGFIHNINPEILKLGIKKCKVVPGRLELVSNNKCPFKVYVDYAHTESALENVISVLKSLYKKRLILVFGCGGNRDKTKRPKMGNVASRLSDEVILTSDNPREEDINDIIQDIQQGMVKNNYQIIPDRFQAIKEALSIAKKNDTVLIAGKGHEKYQVFKGRSIPFDDCKVVEQCLRHMNY